MIKWDWYQSTVDASCPQKSGLVRHLLEAWPMSDFAPAKNLNGYERGGAIVRGDRVLCHLCWGGQPGINCKTTSDESHVLAKALASFPVPHKPTRVDACIDWRHAEGFDITSELLVEYALTKGLAITQQGDWIRNQGRTLYIGSKSSPVRLVLYEKGYEQGGDAPKDWVRLEARVKPHKRVRAQVASWEPDDVFRAQWLPEAVRCIGWDDLQKVAIGTVWKATDDDRARSALLKQYGAIMQRWSTEVGGWEKLGVEIEKALKIREFS